MTVDEILARGWYTDRRGQDWDYFDTRVDYDRWKRWESRGEEDLILDAAEMRLLIERDMHECHPVGMNYCSDHPAVSVLRSSEERVWYVFDRFEDHCHGPAYPTWSEAMEAARALAVCE